MVLDQILDALSAPSLSETEADKLARIGFMEWLWSLPDNADYRALARAADARAAEFKPDAPAIVAFRDLLSEAKSPKPNAVRRGGRAGRRPGRPGVMHRS